MSLDLLYATPMVTLDRNIPCKRGFEPLSDGNFLLTAAMGLVNCVAAAPDLNNSALNPALQIAGKLNTAIKIGKSSFSRSLN